MGLLDDIDGIIARLRHLVCVVEEIIDDIEELKNEHDSKRLERDY